MEQVFVVRRSDFFGGSWPQGFHPCPEKDGDRLLADFAAAGFFVDRARAEQDPGHKQLIPYCVLRQPGGVFWVRRKPAQGESRLHGRLSIGIGGHVNPAGSGVTGSLFRYALLRELEEELDAVQGLEPRFAGLLNDDGDAVGRVHAGLVYLLDLPAGRERNPTVREISKMAGGFGSLAELEILWQDPGRFESWSRILIEAGIPGNKAVSGLRRSHPQPRQDGREESTHG